LVGGIRNARGLPTRSPMTTAQDFCEPCRPLCAVARHEAEHIAVLERELARRASPD
jgi:hypothetical protein